MNLGSIVWIPHLILLFFFLFIRLQDVGELSQLLNTYLLIILCILFIYLQDVRELGQFFEILSSDHSILSSSSVSSSYVNLVNNLKTSHMINLSLPLHPSPESKWTWSIFWISPIWPSFLSIRLQRVRDLGQIFENLCSDHHITFSLSVSREYVNLVNCLNTSLLIIPSHYLRLPLECTWPCISIFNTSHLIIQLLPLHPSPVRT